MSSDPLMDHLEMQSGMHDRCYTPGQYATTEEQEAEIAAKKFDANDRNGGVPCEGNGKRLLTESPSNIDDHVREEGRRIELGNAREAYLRGFYQSEPGLEESDETVAL